MKYFKMLTMLMVLLLAGSAVAMDMKGETFSHKATVDGVMAEFEVMSLASMNMTDPDGNTHHIMAVFKKDGKNMTGLVGKVKVISPSKKSQVLNLDSYPGGNYAAKFVVDEMGDWGVICQFKDEAGVHTVKFWYPYHKM
ncbi:hypothetical protein [Desulfotalea psychrophila]|uniref:hypothetical protein n=1 Tax=Desulfotalea psychrophila TaxID=84980 RepID=UPI0012EA34DC|nr:hypothetical protein [Desulfotalea psychrophila]